MKSQQTKKLAINIATLAVIIVVIGAGYLAFKKDALPEVVQQAAVVDTAAQTTTIMGIEVSRTVRGLNDLNSSVASAATILSTPSFRRFKDFSRTVPAEPVGRENPFSATEWKAKINALEGQAQKKAAQSK